MTKHDKVVKEILHDLYGRKGFNHLLEEIRLESPDIYKEIKNSIKQILIKNYGEMK